MEAYQDVSIWYWKYIDGQLAGLVCKAGDSWSQGHEFNVSFGV